MKKVYLEYNPFLVETKITIDDKPVSEGSKLESKLNTRLQSWLDMLLPELEKECNDDIILTFKGTELDANDVEATIKDYEKRGGIMRVQRGEWTIVKGGKDRLQELIKLFNEMQENCPFDDLKTDDIKKNFARAISAQFEVSVIATMSSGKSTLINAMLGRELVPSKNAACTATIAHIKDDDNMDHFTAECRDENGKIIAQSNNLTADEMSKFNETEKITDIYINGDIPFVSSKDMQLVLLDTPGPNNSRTAEHQKRTFRVIKSDDMPMVMYLMNATQLFTTNDEALVMAVSEAMKKQHGKQAKDRFIFVINKADVLDPQKGESVESAIKEAKQYLKEHGIDDANIYPVSAETAKIIRMSENGIPLSKRQKLSLNNSSLIFDESEMHLENYAPLSISLHNDIMAKLNEAKNNEDEYTETLIHTGVPAVEAAIVEYMDKYAICNKIKEAVDTFKNKIEEKDIMGKLEKEWVANDEERQKVSKQWKYLSNQLAQGEQAKEFSKQIESFNIKDDVVSKRRAILAKCDSRFDDEFFDRYDNNSQLDPDEMKDILNQMKQMIQPLQHDLQTDLEKVVNDSVVKSAEKILEAYKSQIGKLMKENQLTMPGFKFNISTNVLTMELPNVNKIVDKFTEEKYDNVKVGTKTVSDSTWYKPWTWFSDHEEPVFEQQWYSVANAKKVINGYFSPLRQNMTDNIKTISESAIKQSEDFKRYFVEELEKMDKFIQQKAQEIAEASSNKEKLIAKVKEDERKMKWLDDFIKKLDAAVKI